MLHFKRKPKLSRVSQFSHEAECCGANITAVIESQDTAFIGREQCECVCVGGWERARKRCDVDERVEDYARERDRDRERER